MLLTASAAPLAAQYPRAEPGRFEVHGLDFRPDGAWRRRTANIRQQRRILLRTGALSTLNATGTTPSGVTQVRGEFRVPVLLVRPSDAAQPFAPDQYRDVLFNAAPTTRPYSLRSYYAQLSRGAVLLQGTVLGWWAGSQGRAYYEDGCNGIGVTGPCLHPGPGGGPTRMGELLIGALRAFDVNNFDWGQFDNDGPDGVPNSGDDDGYVDFVTFIHPDVDGACGTVHLWSHRWVISAWNGGLPYATHTPRTGRSGATILVDDYTLQSGVGGASACTPGEIMPIGTVAHETGHAFGLPDLYDTDLGNPFHTEGIGEWGLMGSGNYRTPMSPARFEAWSLAEVGWVKLDSLQGSRVVRTGPVTRSDTVFYVPMPGRREYFLIENRQPLQSDSALLNPNRPGGKMPGLLVWHIDEDRLEASGFRETNTVNTGTIQGVALVQADGRNDLRTPGARNRGDPGDPYPGSSGNRRFSWLTNPSAADNAGAYAGFILDQITQVEPGGAMSFRFTRRERSLVRADREGVQVTVNGITADRYDDVLVPGDKVAISAPAAAPAPPGARTSYLFKSWSNGQPASFTLSPSPAAPDTLTARYTPWHLVRILSLTGTGSLTSTPANIGATGKLVADGETATLTAVPASGAQFLGWVGDTTSADPVLSLAVKHPFDVTANFSVSPTVVAVTAAIGALVHSGPDVAPEVAAGLDLAGNKNGRFDTGDVLAYIDRNRATLDPAVIRQLLAQSARAKAPDAPTAGSAP
ncbi:MAG TPA: immune inhibitor A domain-containing protein [Gemmatimonadales bacterium]|nr:immune inhibitor A domain-containing protein [Gemmatimonadales bacterium]